MQKSPYFWNELKIKTVIFGMLKGTENISHRSKTECVGVCVGGNMAILNFGYKMRRFLKGLRFLLTNILKGVRQHFIICL